MKIIQRIGHNHVTPLGSEKIIQPIGHNHSWQSGYGAFSYARRDIEKLYQYILNQEKHHAKITFKKEYIDLLTEFDIPFQEMRLFEWYHE